MLTERRKSSVASLFEGFPNMQTKLAQVNKGEGEGEGEGEEHGEEPGGNDSDDTEYV